MTRSFTEETAGAVPGRPVTDWRDDAECAGAPRELFFAPHIKEGRWRPFCGDCPVVDVCFWAAMVEEEADDTDYRFGVRGAAAPTVRRKVAAASYHGYPRVRLAEAVEAWQRAQAGDADIAEGVETASSF